MKVKGLVNKIFRLSSTSILDSNNFSIAKLSELKEGKTVELEKEDAEDLINKGMAELVKSSKKGDK